MQGVDQTGLCLTRETCKSLPQSLNPFQYSRLQYSTSIIWFLCGFNYCQDISCFAFYEKNKRTPSTSIKQLHIFKDKEKATIKNKGSNYKQR